MTISILMDPPVSFIDPFLPVPRWPAVDRLAARAAYAWNNSPRAALRTARRVWDARGRSVPVVVSIARADLPSIAYLGLPAGEANILQLLEYQRDPVGRSIVDRTKSRADWRDLAAGRWPPADIVVVGGELSRIRTLPAVRAVVAPFRVHLVVDVDADPELMRRRISRRERWEFGRNRRCHEWTLDLDSSPTALDFFYHRMHLPTMRARHGERSRTESAIVAHEGILRNGCLFFVRDGGRPVSGALCHVSPCGSRITTRLLGVLDGAVEHYRSGAFKAVYHLLLEWAAEHGVAQVDFFGTEALLSKGIFQWKRKFDPRVELPLNHFATKRMYLHVRRDTPAVRDFLVANPLLVTTPDGLRPTYFTDSARPPRTEISADCAGLGEPCLVDLDEFLGQPVPGGLVAAGRPS